MTPTKPTAEPPVRRARVIVGATCYVDAEGAMNLAVELAREVGADLEGLLVQDEAILTAVSHPRAFAISYSGGEETTVTADAMLRAFQADAERFRRRLSRLASTATLVAKFRSTEGRLTDAIKQALRAGDMAILGFRRAVRDSGSVVLVLGGQSDPPGFAANLAMRLHKNLIILAGRGREAEIARWFDSHPGPRPEILAFDDPAALLSRLDMLSPAAVIVGADQTGLPGLSRIVDTARCPVIVSAPVPS